MNKLFSRTIKSSQAGFTLVELMIVVAIIGILASIAIPNFQKYQAKSRTTEGKIQLASVFTAEKSYYIEFGSFTGCLGAAGYGPDLGSSTNPANRYYSIGVLAATLTAANCGPAGGASCSGVSWANGAATCASTDGGTGAGNATYWTANKSAVPGGANVAGISSYPTEVLNSTAFTIGASANINPVASNSNYDQWTINDGKVVSNANVGY